MMFIYSRATYTNRPFFLTSKAGKKWENCYPRMNDGVERAYAYVSSMGLLCTAWAAVEGVWCGVVSCV